MWQLLFWICLAEILLFPTVIDMDKKDREPGDFALDPVGLCKVRPTTRLQTFSIPLSSYPASLLERTSLRRVEAFS